MSVLEQGWKLAIQKADPPSICLGICIGVAGCNVSSAARGSTRATFFCCLFFRSVGLGPALSSGMTDAFRCGVFGLLASVRATPIGSVIIQAQLFSKFVVGYGLDPSVL